MIDTVAGAKSSAIVYSIAETAKANNLKPYDYFEYLLTEVDKTNPAVLFQFPDGAVAGDLKQDASEPECKHLVTSFISLSFIK